MSPRRIGLELPARRAVAVALAALLFAGLAEGIAQPAASAATNVVPAGAAPARTAPRAARVVPPPAARAPRAIDFNSFRYIGDANIFNPNRIGRTSNAAPRPVDTIALVGTMEYSKGVFAIFDGSSDQYKKAAKVGDTIAQYTVKKISPDEIVLTRDSKDLSMVVGDQLSRVPGADWTLTAAVRPAPAAAIDAPPVIPAGASDVLKRLMEQRLQELKQ